MGSVQHETLVIVGAGYEEAQEALIDVHQHAVKLFGDGLVTEIRASRINRYQWFVVGPDGSKEGWDLSEEFSAKRKTLMDYMDEYQYGDGSSPIEYIEVGFGDLGGKIYRTNTRDVVFGEGGDDS